MGAEQSALLVCTQTGNHEEPLKLTNAQRFFQLDFENMPEPRTGAVTEALLHLVSNMQEQRQTNSEEQEQDSGYDEWQDQDMVSEEGSEANQLPDNMSIGSTSTQISLNNDDGDFKPVPLEFVELQPVEFLNVEDPELELEKDFSINTSDMS